VLAIRRPGFGAKLDSMAVNPDEGVSRLDPVPARFGLPRSRPGHAVRANGRGAD